MRKNRKSFAIIFAITVTVALSGLTVSGQSQDNALCGKQLLSLWQETYTQLQPARWGSISPAEVSTFQTAGVPFFLLDVRTQGEFEAERIAGAVNIPLDQLPARLSELPADTEMITVVYCKVGQRGALGFAPVRQLGYVNAKNLVGGIDAWKAAGFATETTPVTNPPPGPEPVGLAPFVKQFVTLWKETYTALQPVRWGSIGASETYSLLVAGAPFFALDVRTPAEFASGHIEGAVNIPLDQLPARLNELPADPETIVVVYCKVGQRGALGFMLVRQAGYVNAKNLVGGIDAWKAAGYPVVQ